MSKKKLLIAGAIQGQFEQLFERVKKANETAGPFDALLCVGRFFGDSGSLTPYMDGSAEIPVPTYFIATQKDREHPVLTGRGPHSTLCKNLVYLGESGLADIGGLSVAFMSGTYDVFHKTQTEIDYKEEDVQNLLSKASHERFRGVDILLTNDWPRGILNQLRENAPLPTGVSLLEYDTLGSELVTKVASALMPRYHFAGSPAHYGFYERIPYKNGDQLKEERAVHATRFFGIADAFNKKNQKYLYAFGLTPVIHELPHDLTTIPPHAGPFPFEKYKVSRERPAKRQKTESRFDAGALDVKTMRPNYAQTHNRSFRGKEDPLTAGLRATECWFCVSSSVCEFHLIVTLGTHMYLALAKGPMNDSHMLLSPIKHLTSSIELPPPAREELAKWKQALRDFFQPKGEVPVFFELCQKGERQMHCIIQVVPVKQSVKDSVIGFFDAEGRRCRLDFIRIDPGQTIEEVLGAGTPYFWFEDPNGVQMVASTDRIKIPFSFGRRVLSQIYGMPELEDWKRCVQSKENEERISAVLRQEFAPYQIRLEEGNSSISTETNNQ